MTIISKILDNKCKKFRENYINLSRDIFNNDDNLLIHPGEFGGYREKLVQELIKQFCPTYVQVGDGFVVNSKGDISTQCDFVAHDKDITVVRNDINQSFFISESVYMIGEVKSVIKKKDLPEILKKLAKQKDIIINGRATEPKHPYDQPLSFLICEKFKFEKPMDVLIEIYDSSPECQHNMILSLEDGLFTYYINRKGNDQTMHYPLSVEEKQNIISTGKKPNTLHISDPEHSSYPINLFVGYATQHLSSCNRSKADLVSYLPKSSTEKLDKRQR